MQKKNISRDKVCVCIFNLYMNVEYYIVMKLVGELHPDQTCS